MICVRAACLMLYLRAGFIHGWRCTRSFLPLLSFFFFCSWVDEADFQVDLDISSLSPYTYARAEQQQQQMQRGWLGGLELTSIFKQHFTKQINFQFLINPRSSSNTNHDLFSQFKMDRSKTQ